MKEKLSNNTILKKISRLNLKPNEKLVAYTILAERDENSLECIIGQKRIASSTNTSQQQTAKIINTLKNMHLLTTIRSPRNDKKWFLCPTQFIFLDDLNDALNILANGSFSGLENTKQDYLAAVQKLDSYVTPLSQKIWKNKPKIKTKRRNGRIPQW